MQYRTVWLSNAKKRYQEIINYLEENWTQNEVKNFVHNTNYVINQISLYPLLFKKASKHGVRQAILTKHNFILYRIVGDQIQLLTIFDTRQNPGNKRNFLKNF